MGCTVSTIENATHANTERNYKFADHIPQLSDEQKNVIKNNWQTLKLYVANIGEKTYSSMFESRPELIKTFLKFKGKDLHTLQETGLLKQHALRVMATVDKCITCIDQPSKMKHILREVGHLHKIHHVKPNDIQVILPHFLSAMKSYIQEKWSDDLQDTWIRFLTIVFYHIREGMEEELSSQDVQHQNDMEQQPPDVE